MNFQNLVPKNLHLLLHLKEPPPHVQRFAFEGYTLGRYPKKEIKLMKLRKEMMN